MAKSTVINGLGRGRSSAAPRIYEILLVSIVKEVTIQMARAIAAVKGAPSESLKNKSRHGALLAADSYPQPATVEVLSQNATGRASDITSLGNLVTRLPVNW